MVKDTTRKSLLNINTKIVDRVLFNPIRFITERSEILKKLVVPISLFSIILFYGLVSYLDLRRVDLWYAAKYFFDSSVTCRTME